MIIEEQPLNNNIHNNSFNNKLLNNESRIYHNKF